MKIFRLPDLGEGLAEAEVREWYVKVGDTVKVDQPLVSMETAKAVVDVPSPYAGKIVELHGKANEIVKTGAPLISFESQEGASEKPADKGSVVGKLESSEKKWDDSDVIIGSARTASKTIKAMPAARVLATQMGVDLSQITPTGPQGLVTVEDVKNAMGATSHHETRHPRESGDLPGDSRMRGNDMPGKTESLRGVRRVMAQAMMQSHREIVPVTIIEDADITDLPPKSDLTVRLMQAMTAAAKAEPALNAWFDGKTLERKVFTEINIGMALDTAEGLFVPVIKDVANRSPEELRKIIDTYKQTVSDRTVAASDMQGATITLSNFGTIAGCYATPIIVPPAVAILGVGRSREVALPRDGKIIVGRILPLSLTFDHRAVTGGEATRYLNAVIKNLK